MNNAVAAAGGGDFAMALLQGGTVKAWGTNGSGQLEVAGLSEVASIAAGWSSGLVLKRDGSVWQSGGFLTETHVPSEVSLPGAATAISARNYDDLAVISNGKLFSWGSNALKYHSDLGIGEVLGPETCPGGWGPCSLAPLEVSSLSSVGALGGAQAAALGAGGPPAVTYLGASSGEAGTEVPIVGSALANTSAVDLGSVPATLFAALSPTKCSPSRLPARNGRSQRNHAAGH